MKPNTTYVPLEKYQGVITGVATKLKLSVKEQAGFIKIQGAKGRQVYVAKSKNVGRVDLSGFEMPEGDKRVTRLGGESFGAVKQQMFLGLPEAEVLRNFEDLLTHLASLPAAEPVKRVRPGQAAGASATGNAPPQQPISEREAKIREIAAKKGLEVSGKTEAKIAEGKGPKADAKHA